MKTKILAAIAFSISINVQAKEIVIDDTVHEIEVQLSEDTVQCLVGDYGASSFKIVIPDIHYLARLDHTSKGSSGPCINAGYCSTQSNNSSGIFRPGDKDYRFSLFHNTAKPTEIVNLRVVKKEEMVISNNICTRNYSETITAKIRGTDFKHFASVALAPLSVKACQAMGAK